jgi:hypothetical protein
MKSGCNFNDVNAIKRMADEGQSVDSISRYLQIKSVVVASFMPEATLSRGQKAAATRKANQEAALEQEETAS